MAERWRVLAVLFLVRTTMAFQFQSAAALSPLLMERFGVGLAEIGFLIGLYLAPGIVIAFPGGAIGARLGEARVAAFGLGLMIVGGALVATGASWEAQVAGRLIAGIGGVAINVLMSKMVTDWFAGREIATAMGVFLNSWPIGIASALVLLPWIAEAGGLGTALWVVSGVAGIGLMLLVLGYRPPPGTERGTGDGAGGTASGPVAAGRASGALPTGHALTGILAASGIWALYNGALAMVFAFAPAMLVERGFALGVASGATSFVLWFVAVSIPLGGLVADRLGRRDAVLAAGVVAFAVLLALLPLSEGLPTVLFALLGLAAGLSAGPIMALPGAMLPPGVRAGGMGLFFTIFYVGVFVAPVIAGGLADVFRSAEAAMWFGVALLAAMLPLLAIFRVMERRSRPA